MDNMILESGDVMRRNNSVPYLLLLLGCFSLEARSAHAMLPYVLANHPLVLFEQQEPGDTGQSSSRATTSIYFDNRTVTVLMATKLEGLLCQAFLLPTIAKSKESDNKFLR